MRKLILAAFVAAMPFVALADDELPSTYTLISSTRKILDTGEEVKDTYGKHPSGSVNVRQGRTFPGSGRLRWETKTGEYRQNDGSAGHRSVRSMLAYGGTYKFDGKSIKHETTRPAPFSGDGKMSVVTVVWEKVK
jgi:hypothetical protein